MSAPTIPAPHGPGRTRSAAELEALAREAAIRFADADAATVLAWAGETFGTSLAVACSMAGDTVVPHLAAQQIPGVDVLFLQTGYHFAETIGTRDALADTLANLEGSRVSLLREQEDVDDGAALRRYRARQADDPLTVRVQRGIHLSINGIAAGLRNTG